MEKQTVRTGRCQIEFFLFFFFHRNEWTTIARTSTSTPSPSPQDNATFQSRAAHPAVNEGGGFNARLLSFFPHILAAPSPPPRTLSPPPLSAAAGAPPIPLRRSCRAADTFLLATDHSCSPPPPLPSLFLLERAASSNQVFVRSLEREDSPLPQRVRSSTQFSTIAD